MAGLLLSSTSAPITTRGKVALISSCQQQTAACDGNLDANGATLQARVRVRKRRHEEGGGMVNQAPPTSRQTRAKLTSERHERPALRPAGCSGGSGRSSQLVHPQRCQRVLCAFVLPGRSGSSVWPALSTAPLRPEGSRGRMRATVSMFPCGCA